MSSKKVKISLDNKSIEVPIIEGTLGYKAIDTSTFNKEHLFSYDPGFTSTAACKSAITFVDGEKGELLYRGCLLYTSPSPRDLSTSRMPSSA